MYNLLSLRILIYNIFVNVFIPFVTLPANVTRFGISLTQVDALNRFLIDWNLKYADYVNPLTYGRLTINAIHEAISIGYPLTQSIRNKIKEDTTIILTSREREICDIKIPDPRNRTKVPTIAPALVCYQVAYLLMRFAALNPELLFKRKKPAGVEFIGYKIVITAMGIFPRDTDYVIQEALTDTEFEVLFTPDQIGKVLWIKAFYLNAKNEAGPDSIPVMVVIG